MLRCGKPHPNSAGAWHEGPPLRGSLSLPPSTPAAVALRHCGTARGDGRTSAPTPAGASSGNIPRSPRGGCSSDAIPFWRCHRRWRVSYSAGLTHRTAELLHASDVTGCLRLSSACGVGRVYRGCLTCRTCFLLPLRRRWRRRIAGALQRRCESNKPISAQPVPQLKSQAASSHARAPQGECLTPKLGSPTWSDTNTGLRCRLQTQKPTL